MRRALIVLACCSPVFAQEAPLAAPAAPAAAAAEGDVAAAIAQFEEMALRKVAPRDQPARAAEVQAWADRNANLELGDYGFLRHLARYFARDYTGAGDGLLEWLAAHPALPTKVYDVMVGRICFARAIVASRDGAWPIYDRALPHALALYDPPLTIYRGTGAALRRTPDNADAKQRLVQLIGQCMTDTRLTIDDRLDIATGIFGGGSGGKAATPTRPQPVFKPFAATAMDGVERSTASYRGKVLLIDFWATWCGPCIGEMPNVVKAYQQHHAAGLEILGITLDGTDAEAKIRAKMDDLGMTWPQIYDGRGWKAKLAVDCAVRSIPATFLIGRDGTVRHTNLRGQALIDAIAKLVAEPAPAQDW